MYDRPAYAIGEHASNKSSEQEEEIWGGGGEAGAGEELCTRDEE